MAKTVLETTGAQVQVAGQGMPTLRLDLNQRFGQLGSINEIRKEIDDAFADMRTFHNLEPDAVMRLCAGHSARMSEIRVQIQRIEDMHRQWRPVRINEVEPTLSELQTQFNIASRLVTVRELDWRMETGAR
jgi:hypothetical protein